MKGHMNTPLQVGDRVICYHMEGEIQAPIGIKGTVTRISEDPFEMGEDGEIISVDWDNGSTLSLISSTDAWKKIGEKPKQK